MRNPIIQEDVERIVAADLPWEKLYGKRVLITGANGFVPAYMVDTLSYLNETRGANIKIRLLARNRDKIAVRFGYLKGAGSVIQDIRAPYYGHNEYVIHAAAQASPKFYGTDPVGTIEANVIGTRNMLQAAVNNCEGFLYFSSGDVYSNIDPLNSRACYSEGKRAGEALCAAYHAQYGVPIKTIRLSHTYGPGMALDDGRVFADFVADVVNKRDIVMKSEGEDTRPFCYLADATIAFFTVLLKGNVGESYNIGAQEETSILNLAGMLCAMFPPSKLVRKLRDKDDPYIPAPPQGGHLDIAKIRALGWEPTTGVREGFSRTVRSYQ